MKHLTIVLAFLVGACASESLIPNAEQIKVSKDEPKSSCKSLGHVSGRTMTAKGDSKEALEDMKKDASRLSANYVKIEEYSGLGTSVTGEAFRCE